MGESRSVRRPGVAFSGERFFLSNFYPHPFVFRGREYPTAEHAFQAAKCVDTDEAERVRLAATPAAARRIGQRARLGQSWNDIRVDVMHEVLEAKFADPDLRARLLATGADELVEENTWNDRFWGRSSGVGRNMLGRLLMELRDSLRSPDA
jgi:ribA/ribD-fused uncharacterized protein